MKNKVQIPNKILSFVPVLLAFLMPVFYLPITTEFFEFNKLALLLVATMVSILVWVAKMLLDRKVQVTRSAVDIPLLLMLVIVILASMFSLDRVSSIYGAQGRWYPSLLGVVTTLVFYYVTTTNIGKVKTIKLTLLGLLGGITVNSLVSVMSYFGIYLGAANYLRSPNFTLTGSTLNTALLAALSVVLVLTFIVNTKNYAQKIAITFAGLVNVLAAVIFGGWAGWFVLAVAVVLSLFGMPTKKLSENKIQMGILAGFTVALIAISIVPSTRDLLANDSFNQERRLPLRESWIVTTNTIRDAPVLGTGPSTFRINYSRYKPVSTNTTDLWNVRFDKPFNEVFGVLGAYGLVGAVIMGYLFYRVYKLALTVRAKDDEYGLNVALFAGILTMFAYYLVGYATVLNTFVFVLLIALAVAKLALDEKETAAESIIVSLSSFKAVQEMSLIGNIDLKKREIFQYILSVPLVLLVILGVVFTYRIYLAEVYMQRSIEFARQNNGSLAYAFQLRAIGTYDRRPFYHNAYAQTNIALANTIANTQAELNQEEAATIQTLIAQAIRNSRVSTELLNPVDAANWEVRGDVYRSLIGFAGDADEWAIRSYSTAIQLDPANPQLRIDLGGVYYLTGDYLSAASQFRTATQLKPDYANAYYNLAQSLIQLNALPDALRSLEQTRRYVPLNSADYQRVTREINDLQRQIQEAGQTAESRPSVQEIEEIVTPEQQPTDQEPIATPEEQVEQETPQVEVTEPVEPQPVEEEQNEQPAGEQEQPVLPQ